MISNSKINGDVTLSEEWFSSFDEAEFNLKNMVNSVQQWSQFMT